jgi:hypothetical protein
MRIMSSVRIGSTEGVERIEYEPVYYERFRAYLRTKIALVDILAALDLLRKNSLSSEARETALRRLSNLVVEMSTSTVNPSGHMSFVMFEVLSDRRSREEELGILRIAQADLEQKRIDQDSFTTYLNRIIPLLEQMDKTFKEDQAKVLEPIRHSGTLY